MLRRAVLEKGKRWLSFCSFSGIYIYILYICLRFGNTPHPVGEVFHFVRIACAFQHLRPFLIHVMDRCLEVALLRCRSVANLRKYKRFTQMRRLALRDAPQEIQNMHSADQNSFETFRTILHSQKHQCDSWCRRSCSAAFYKVKRNKR